jgi:hypothetical protein
MANDKIIHNVTGAYMSEKEFNRLRTWCWLRGISKMKFLSASLKKDIGENRHLLPLLQNVMKAKMQEEKKPGGEEDGN